MPGTVQRFESRMTCPLQPPYKLSALHPAFYRRGRRNIKDYAEITWCRKGRKGAPSGLTAERPPHSGPPGGLGGRDRSQERGSSSVTHYRENTDAIWLSHALSIDISSPLESMPLPLTAFGFYPVFVF